MEKVRHTKYINFCKDITSHAARIEDCTTYIYTLYIYNIYTLSFPPSSSDCLTPKNA